MSEYAERLAAIVVHDVAPATWPACRVLLDMIDGLGAPPVTLLVVPHFHRGVHCAASDAFIEAMNARLARGDELALHGWFHDDDSPPPRSPREYIARRLLTRSEGEFAAIPGSTARRRLQHGIELFASQRWPLHGFVPPAWLLNVATRDALDASGHRFDYVPVRGGIHRLPGWRLEATANLCYSPDRAWRRAISRAQIACESKIRGKRRLLRLSLHPLDRQFPAVLTHWRSLIIAALRDRRPVTKRQAMSERFPAQADASADLGKLSGT